jgi:hypothetical protein
MFIDHFAGGFAAKKFAPRTSLALLLAALCFLYPLELPALSRDCPIFLRMDYQNTNR